MLDAPHVAYRDCAHCLKYDYDERTGEPLADLATGEPLPRPSEAWAPCRMHAAGKRASPCPKGTPEAPRTLWPLNQMAYQFVKEGWAVGTLPDDAIVRRNAAIIRFVEESSERLRADMTQMWLKTAAGVRWTP